MTTWTPRALVDAVTEATTAPRPPVGECGRSWRTATAHLADLLAVAPTATRPAGR